MPPAGIGPSITSRLTISSGNAWKTSSCNCRSIKNYFSTRECNMFDDFIESIDQHWVQTCVGPGSLSVSASLPRSSLPAATPTSNTSSVGILRGTAGFGFWNYPFSIKGDSLMLPEAVWFFYASPPSNMALVPGVPGWGWKAQVVHSLRPGALFATVPTALSAGWARVSGNSAAAGRWLRRLSGACEALISADMTEWHTYTLDWFKQKAIFSVDGVQVLNVLQPPARPLGFVAWLDNQYAVVTPRGTFRFGTVTGEAQWFELDMVSIEAL